MGKQTLPPFKDYIQVLMETENEEKEARRLNCMKKVVSNL